MKKYDIGKSSVSEVAEPMVTFGAINYFALANASIDKNRIKEVIALSKLSLSELIKILPISIDTYKRKTVFGPPVSEKILEIQEIYTKGLNAFGDGFHTWMMANNVALGGIAPKSLLKNSFGVRQLLDQIGRMEHGVLA